MFGGAEGGKEMVGEKMIGRKWIEQSCSLVTGNINYGPSSCNQGLIYIMEAW